MTERGIDVFEKYQGAVNWQQVAASGVKHALIKLSNGSNVASPAGDHYVTGARAAGLRVGGYAYALGGDPVAEANAFADELLRLSALDDAPELDYEDPSLPQGSTAPGWIVAFFVQLRVRIPWLTTVLLYSSGSMLTRIGAGAITVPGLRILIWDAEYSTNDGANHPMHYYTGPVAVHQYTSAGHVPGISGAVDLDDVITDITESASDWIDMATQDEVRQAMVDALNQVFLGERFADNRNFGDEAAQQTGSLLGIQGQLDQVIAGQAAIVAALGKIAPAAPAVLTVTGDLHLGPAPTPPAS